MGERTVVVTGANTGIGRATAQALAGQGWRVFVAARSAGKGSAAVAAIKAATGSSSVFFLSLDLADLESVRSCASEFLARGEPLHVLINNAGVGGARGLTKQGFELMFGVNHLGHFALCGALLDRLAASAPARVVTVSSDAHYNARGVDFEAVRRPARGITGLGEYAVSKLCNVLFSQELARRTAGTGVTDLRAPSGRRGVGHLAAGAVAGAAAGHPSHALGERRSRDVAVLRDLAGGGAGQRLVLRQVRGTPGQPGGDSGTGPGTVGAQRELDRAVPGRGGMIDLASGQ